jgi:alpha-aminoadipate carrier protein LysW
MEKAMCPECDAPLEIPNGVVTGEILTCPICGLELEVSQVNANNCVELRELVIEGEDWGE